MSSSLTCRALTDGVNSTRSVSPRPNTRFKTREQNAGIGKAKVSFGMDRGRHWGPGSVVKSVLDKPRRNLAINGSLGGCGPTDPGIVALERLFQQAQWHEERCADPKYANESGLELAVCELEEDLIAALNALRLKEEELRAAEYAVKTDQREVEMTRSALLNREKELEAAYSIHSAKRDELRRVHEDLMLRGKELQASAQAVEEREAELNFTQESLRKRQEGLEKLRASVLEKDDALTEAASNIKMKELEIEQANNLLAKQVADKEVLRAALLEKDTELEKLREDRQWKQGMLERMEAELKERTEAWLCAQKDLKAFEQDLAGQKVRGKVRETEFSQIKVLLTEVQSELDESRLLVANLRQTVDEHGKLLKVQHMDLASNITMLALYEKNLTYAKGELEKEQEQTKAARLSYEILWEELKREREVMSEQRTALVREKGVVQELSDEVNTLKREAQQRDSALSDTQLKLKLTEAELVGTKLELQQVKTELSSMKLVLSQKDVDLQAAQDSVTALQEEIAHVKGLLQSKEEQLTQVTLLLNKKEEEVANLRVDLDDSHAQMNKATSMVQQITELSRSLVDATVGQDIFEESSMLAKKNLELLAIKKALFESEMQVGRLKEQQLGEGLWQQEVEAELKAVKEALQERNRELLEAQLVLASRDEELKEQLSRWDTREHEITELRKDVSAEAKAVSRVRTTQLQGLSGDTAAQLIECERAKLEVEAVMEAVRGLTNLSASLLKECQYQPLSRSMAIGSLTNSFTEVGAMKARLCERDAALEITKGAMADLTTLTKQLMKEAGLETFDYQKRASASA